MKYNNIDVFEHSVLAVATSKEELFDGLGKRVKISKGEFLHLQRYHSNVSSDFFKLLHNKIKFNHYVGLIRVGSLNINILPKVDEFDTDERKWHQILMQMILFTKDLRYKRSSMSLLLKEKNSILDLYINEFYKEVEEILRKGIRKTYSLKENNLSTIKGKIIFNRDIILNSSDRSRTYCCYQVYSSNNVFNFIIYSAIRASLKMTNNLSLIDTGRSLLDFLPEVTDFKITNQSFERIRFNRNNSYYKNAIKLAKLILQDTGLNLSYGQENVVSFLFNMENLFQEFIYKMCKMAFREDEFIVHRKVKRYWEKKLIRPDIVIENKKSQQTVIIDTKWKVPKDEKPNDADLKQIFVYNHYYSSPLSYLLYPKNELSDKKWIITGDFSDYDLKGETIANSCYLGFISINHEGRLDRIRVQKRLKEMFDVAINVKKKKMKYDTRG